MTARRYSPIGHTHSAVAETNDLSSVVTWANVPDANVTESSVTQHSAAISTALSLNVANWDTAYGWGDHSAAGYVDGSAYLPLAGGIMTGSLTVGDGTADMNLTVKGSTNYHYTIGLTGDDFHILEADNAAKPLLTYDYSTKAMVLGYPDVAVEVGELNIDYTTTSGSGHTAFNWQGNGYNYISFLDSGYTYFRAYDGVSAYTTIITLGADTMNLGATLSVTGTHYVDAYGYKGNGNVGGTGEAIYCPSGVYSTGNNWLYGTIYTSGSSIQAGAGSFVGADVSVSGHLIRTDHATGFLEGGYTNISASSTAPGTIFSIGSAFQPTSTTMGTVYGCGYSHSNCTDVNSTDIGSAVSGWGFWVAHNGTVRTFIEDSGHVQTYGNLYAAQLRLNAMATTSYILNGNAAGVWQFQGTSGYVQLGSQDATWGRLQSDRGKFYCNKGIHQSGIPIKYTLGAMLWHGESAHSSGKITVSTSGPSGGTTGDIWLEY